MPTAKQPSRTSPTRPRTAGRKNGWRTLSSALVVVTFLFSAATAASAAPPAPVDAATVPDVRKPEVASEIKAKVANDYCSGEVKTTALPWDINHDVDPKSEKFAKCRSYALGVLPSGFDQLLPYTTVDGRSVTCKPGGVFYVGVGLHDYSPTSGYKTQWCAQVEKDTAGSKNDERWRAFWSGIIGAGGVAAVDFVANPQGSVDKLANSLKTDATSALTQVINDVSRATDFDPNDDWFRTQWAAFAGIGVLVLAFMVLRTMRDYGEEKITAEETTHALIGFGPVSLVLVLFGPALGHFLNTQISTLNTGIINFTSGSMLGFAKATDFNGVESGGAFGPVAGIIIWGLLLLGAWSILLLFIVQGVALSLIGVGLAIALGFLVHPLWRKRAMKAGTTYLGILLAKPLLLLILGFIMALIGAHSPVKGGSDDALSTGLRILTIGVVLLAFGCAPATLLKYMPLLPNGGDSVAHHNTGTGRAVVAGAAGAMMSSRMFSKSASPRGRQTSTAGASRNNAAPRAGTGTSSGTGSAGGNGPSGGNGTSGGTGPSNGTTSSAAVGEKASSVSNAAPSASASPGNSGSSTQKTPGTSGSGVGDVGKLAGAGVRAGVPLVAGTAKVAAGVALKSALAAANAAASSGKSQAHDHAPNMD